MKSSDKENEFILVTDENFEEQAYLASNPDVAQAVRQGIMASGRIHFEQFGRNEKRRVKASDLSRRLSNPQPGLVRILFPFLKKTRSLFVNSPGNSQKTFNREQADLDDTERKRLSLAQEYLQGAGIEIGALHHPLPVPQNVTVRYLDRMSVQQLREQYPELNQLPLVNVDIITDGETLDLVDDNSQDFVIANHFLEHCQNPLFTIENMLRVLKQNGILFIAVPDKRYTFDIDRPVTTYQHLEKDYRDGGKGSKKQHFEEWVKLVYHITDELEAAKKVKALVDINYSIHFHVWTQNEVMEMILNLKQKLAFEMELICRNHNEVVFILRKR
jgi:predicted SAM-dependent methyltransferase